MWQSLEVYGCSDFSKEFKDKVIDLKGKFIEIEKFTEIYKNIYLTGTLEGNHKGKYISEQALFIKTDNGVSIITGCSHFGILNIFSILNNCLQQQDIYLIMGGFHLKDTDKKSIEYIVSRFKKNNVKKVAPTHCSGKQTEEIFKDIYKENFIYVKVGQTIRI
jgi:7,8-dihydropterin-6-yl-methyl-4-(beta-D-ribofuranosyl)aminobenzene 5'-phosphate synthase